MLRFYRGSAVILTILLLPFFGHAQLDTSAARDRIVIGGPLDVAPYTYFDDSGVYTGFSVDVMRAAGEILAIDNVLFYPASQDENLKALIQGELDCLHFVRYTSHLARDFTFAAIYLESPSVIFVRSERYDMANQEDLEGKKIAILKEDPAYERLRLLGKHYFFTVDHHAEAFRLLWEEEVDAYIGERLSGLRYLGKRGLNERFKIIGTEVAISRFGMLVRKDQRELAQQIKYAFRELEKSGKQARISYQWFGEGGHSQPVVSRRFIRWIMIFVGASLLVATIVLGWNLLLQRELQLKAIVIEKTVLDKEIMEEKSRFEAIVQSMTEGLMLVDPHGKIAYLNAHGAQYLGRRIQDLLNHPLSVVNDYILAKVEDPEILRRKLEHAELNPTRPSILEYTMTAAKRIDVRLKFFPVRDLSGAYAGRGILLEDITHERAVERLKSEFVSIASHELRTPMTSILGFSELMLLKDLPGDVVKRYTTQIHSEAERLTRILNDMLDISYLESGEGILEKKQLRIVDLVNEVVENFRAQLKDRRDLHVRISGNPQIVTADQDKITQVLWNLLSNADKYSAAGREVLIDVIARRQADPEWGINIEELDIILPAVELKVTDFGQGIPHDQLSMIFIPFHRVETEVHTIRGTGLGLAIVKRIVEAHGGRVWAFSEPGKQTVFSVLLPVERT